MGRRNFSRKTQRQALARVKGQCEPALPSGERCPCAIESGRCRSDHVMPDGIGGAPTLENRQVICVDCDRAKYPRDRATIDAPGVLRPVRRHHRPMAARDAGRPPEPA